MSIERNSSSSRHFLPSRKSLEDAVKRHKRGLCRQELLHVFKLDSSQQSFLQSRLDAMCRDRQLMLMPDERYQSTHKSGVMQGTVFISEGRKCIKLDDDSIADPKVFKARLVLHARYTNGWLDGDKVRAMLVWPKDGADGNVVAMDLQAREREVVGVVTKPGFIKPLHEIGTKKIRLLGKQAAELKKGQSVLARLCMPEQTHAWSPAESCAELISILLPESHGRSNFETEVALRAFNVPAFFTTPVQTAARACKGHQPSAQGRVDLRDLPFVTVDGETAKDFDDAIACRQNTDGWQLWVAIADVAAYVQSGDALDREARRRGNSVYFSNGRCVPMLPTELSEDLCSLRPNQDRPALTVSMQLSSSGEVLDYHFMPAVIRSRARLSYTQVNALLCQGKESQISQEISDMLMTARLIYQRLNHNRRLRGALNVELPAPIFLFAEDGQVHGIVKGQRYEAHKIIEEFMICANVCAARFTQGHHKDFLYRVHLGLKDGAYESLQTFLSHRGLFLQGQDTAALMKLVAALEGRGDAEIIQSFILRSLRRAVYQPDNQGHFGLALSHYAHYTSPIRRYPDLVLHRALYSVLDLPGGCTYPPAELERIGWHCSMTEKRADEVSRDIDRYLRCLYAEDKIGQVHKGVIVGVTAFGLFVELDSLHLEGLLYIGRLGYSYYEFLPQQQCLAPEYSGRTYHLGDSVRVKIIRVSPEKRQIDFCLA